MNRRTNRYRWSLSLLALPVAMLATLAGCEYQNPSVGLSDPAVYLAPHIQAAQAAYAADVANSTAFAAGRDGRLSTMSDLQRYFASPVTGWDGNRLRMDEMLDQTQQSESFARIVATSLDIKATLSPKLDLPTANAAAESPIGTDIGAADLAALVAVLSTTPNDSPFDKLERVRSFYSSYIIALLRVYGTDSRVLNLAMLNPIATLDAFAPVPPENYETTINEARASVARARAESGVKPPPIRVAGQSQPNSRKPPPAVLPDSRRGGLTLGPFVKDSLPGEGTGASTEENKTAPTEALMALFKRRQDAEQAVTVRRETVENAYLAFAEMQEPIEEALQAVLKARISLANAQERLRTAPDATKKEATDAAAVAQQRLAIDEASYATYANIGRILRESYDQAVSDLTLAQTWLADASHALEHYLWTDANNRAMKAAASIASREFRSSNGSLEAPKRLILLLFQPHIEPGNKPDQMVGINIEVTAATGSTTVCPRYLKSVKVLYIHPSRTYDTSDQRVLNQVQQSLSAAVAAKLGGNINASIAVDHQKREEARGSYLSRVNKTTSFATLSSRNNPTFGWRFYPSNVVVSRSGGGYKARGFLEGGGRDCAVWLMVDPAVRHLELTVSQFSGGVDHGAYSRSNGETTKMMVQLPPYSALESGQPIVSSPMAGPLTPPVSLR